MAELNSSREKSRGRRVFGRLPGRVDLTAMVDLAFLLITFFMLTTVLSKPKVMPVTMPAGDKEGPVPETRTMTICLGKNNRLLWYLGLPDRPLSGPEQIGYGSDLSNSIKKIKNQIFKTSGKGMVVIVKPASHSTYKNLVETLDDLNIARVPSYAIAKISHQDIAFLKRFNIY